MIDFLNSLPPEVFDFLACFLVLSVFFTISNFLRTLISWIYCTFRRRKPRRGRCFFWDCPTYDNCPYNPDSREPMSLKEFFMHFKNLLKK